MDNNTRANVIKAIRNTITFKQTLIKLTEEEITEMEKEIQKIKDDADNTVEFNPQTASISEMSNHFAAESTNIP